MSEGKNWVGNIAKDASPETLRGAGDYIDTTLRFSERDAFSLGKEITPERVQAVRDLEAVTVTLAESVGVDIRDRVLPEVSRGHIRFLRADEFDPTGERLKKRRKEHGVTTSTGFMAIIEADDPGTTLLRTQHELIHKMAFRSFRLKSGTELGSWQVGISTTGFVMLDEAITVMITDDAKKLWKNYGSLAPYSDMPDPHRQRRRGEDGGFIFNIGDAFATMLAVMTEKATQESGHDAKEVLYRTHFAGGVEVLRLFSSVFGNEAVTGLSKLDDLKPNVRTLLEFCDSLGVRRELALALGLKETA